MDSRPDRPTFLVAAEDRGGFTAVTRLADRVVCEELDWVEASVLEFVRVWMRPDAQREWISITHAKRAGSRHRRARGHFEGSPGAPDAANTRRILLDVFEGRHQRPIDALFIARDLDRNSARLKGMRQAVGSGAWPFAVILAWSEPEIEAWYIAGFEASTSGESSRVGELIRELGFDPTRAAHKLTSTARGSPKDAKRVLDRLSGGDRDRQSRCLEAPLPLLYARGARAGVAKFLDEVRVEILPIFRRSRP